MARKSDSFYFDSFCACAELSCKAARLLADAMRNFDPERIDDQLTKMHEIEQEADERKHAVQDALVTAFVTPVEREDIVLLCDYLDTVVDRIEGVLHRLYFDNVRTIRADALKLVEMIERSTREMVELMKEFPQFKHSKSLRDHVISINSIEEEADNLYISSMRELHTTCTDPIEVFVWHEIYTYLEYSVDTCEHVADTVASIVMKNS